MHGEAPRKRKRKESGSRSPSVSVTASSRPSSPCRALDFAAVADRDAVALEVVDQVVGHRLGEVGAAVQEGDQGAAARQPDRRLRRRVAAADHAHPLAAAELRLGRAGGVEDADPLVAVEVGDRQAPVFGAGREQHRAGGDLVAVLEPDEVALGAGLERRGAVGRRRAGAELARLGDRAAGQLGAADPRREAEVVLDPPRGAGLAAEHGALDDQRVEALRGAVDRGAEAGRPAADDEQVDLLALLELEPDPERPRELPVARPAQLVAAGEPHERDLVGVERRRSGRPPPRSRPGRARSGGGAGAGRSRAGGGSRSDSCGPMISMPDPLALLQHLAPLDEGGEEQVGERAVLEEQLPQDLAIDGDVAHRLGDDGGEEDGLPGEQVHLAEEAGGAVADDLLAGAVEDRRLALDDRDERVALVADLEQRLAGLGGRAPRRARRASRAASSRALDLPVGPSAEGYPPAASQLGAREKLLR